MRLKITPGPMNEAERNWPDVLIKTYNLRSMIKSIGYKIIFVGLWDRIFEVNVMLIYSLKEQQKTMKKCKRNNE